MVQLMIGGIHSGIGVVTKQLQTIDKTNNSQALWPGLYVLKGYSDWRYCVLITIRKGLLKIIDVYS